MHILSANITPRHIGDLLSPLAWFAYMRQRAGKALLWEDGLGKYAFVGAQAICTILKRGNTLIRQDHIYHKYESVAIDPYDTAAIQAQVNLWMADYFLSTAQADLCSWWGYQVACSFGKEDIYYQLYAYNFIFDYTTGIMQEVYLYPQGQESVQTMQNLWEDFKIPELQSLAIQKPWRAKVSETLWQEQLSTLQELLQAQYVQALQSTKIWQCQYNGDIFQWYRAMRKQPKQNRGKYCFFIDAGHFQWMGEGGFAPLNINANTRLLLQNAADEVFPSATQVGYPMQQAQIYLMDQSKQGYFAFDLVKLNMMEAFCKRQDIQRGFLTLQGHVLYAFTQQLLDRHSTIDMVQAAHKKQFDIIEKIAQDIAVF